MGRRDIKSEAEIYALHVKVWKHIFPEGGVKQSAYVDDNLMITLKNNFSKKAKNVIFINKI